MNIQLNVQAIKIKAPFVVMAFLALLTHTAERADMMGALVGGLGEAKTSGAQHTHPLEGTLQPIADRLGRLSDSYLEFEETNPRLARIALTGAMVLTKTTLGAVVGAVGGSEAGLPGIVAGAGVGAVAGTAEGVAGEVMGTAVHAVAGEKIEAVVDYGVTKLSPLLMDLDPKLTPEGAITLGSYGIAATLSAKEFSGFLKGVKGFNYQAKMPLLTRAMENVEHHSVHGTVHNLAHVAESGIMENLHEKSLHQALGIKDIDHDFSVEHDSHTHIPITSPYEIAFYRDLWNKKPKEAQYAADRLFYAELEGSFRDYLNSGTLPSENPYEAYRPLWNAELTSSQKLESQESPFYTQLKDSFRDYVNDGTLPRESFSEAYRPLWNSEFMSKHTLESAPFYPAAESTFSTFRDTWNGRSAHDSGYYNPVNDPSFMRDSQAFWNSYQEQRSK